jgi:hypothetical protein
VPCSYLSGTSSDENILMCSSFCFWKRCGLKIFHLVPSWVLEH